MYLLQPSSLAKTDWLSQPKRKLKNTLLNSKTIVIKGKDTTSVLLHVLCSVALSGSVVVLRKELFLYLSDSEVVFVFPLITYILLWVNTACMVENQ
jgi:hypothetical protein